MFFTTTSPTADGVILHEGSSPYHPPGKVTSRRPQGTSKPDAAAEEGTVMATSGVEEVAMRLLEAFYDLSGQDPTRPVPVGAPGSSPRESAAATAGIEPGSTECAIAVRYLLNQGYLEKTDAPSNYTITVPGIDRVREMRGLADPAKGGNRMSEKTQRRLLTLLAIAIAMVLTRPVNRFIEEEIPERRGIGDDLTEAALQGLVRAAAFFAASLLVRRLAGPR